MARKKQWWEKIDWGKVAMAGGGALILWWIFRPRKAAAAVLPEQATSKTVDQIPAEEAIDDLDVILSVPRFARVGGKCIDYIEVEEPAVVDPAHCQRCDEAKPGDADFDFCYPPEWSYL
jgi:hypothetical protein